MTFYLAESAGVRFVACETADVLHLVDGDTHAIVGNLACVVRGGVVVQSSEIINRTIIPPTVVHVSGSVNQIILLERVPMPGVAATLVRTTRNLTTGEVTFEYSDGDTRPYANWGEVGINKADPIDTTNTFAKDLIEARAYRNDPTGADITSCDGSIVAVDLNAQNPISCQFAGE